MPSAASEWQYAGRDGCFRNPEADTPFAKMQQALSPAHDPGQPSTTLPPTAEVSTARSASPRPTALMEDPLFAIKLWPQAKEPFPI